MSFTLTTDQSNMLTEVQNFLLDKDNPALVIMGSSGTGKTTLTKYIVNYIIDNRMSIVAVAPTHKARRVLSRSLNIDRLFEITSLTVASILGKMREHTYIGSHRYKSSSKQKMDKFDCFIVDEISMVSDKDLDEIIDYICEEDKKLILIGDNCQIPAPNQKLVKNSDNVCYKPDSSAFDIENLYELREIVRQVSNSPIIRIGTYLRDHILEDNDLKDILHGCNIPLEDICIDKSIMYRMFLEDLTHDTDSRIIAYTNVAVRSHNENIRKELGYIEKLVVGELLTGYDNVGWPVPLIENGTDYKVISIRKTGQFKIDRFCNLVGDLVDIVDIDDPTHVSRELFFIDVKHSANAQFMLELVYRAEKVNQMYSKKQDYKNYCALKNRAIFLEDVYKYSNKVITETIFKHLHPLLFTKISEVINTECSSIAISELTKKLEDQYGDIIEGRLIDNKPFADAEVFADQHMVVEKDIYYGYSITSHKSQGSTYEHVYVDETDFKKISNKWNYKFHAIENRSKERNQLKYVAYTRASKILKIVI